MDALDSKLYYEFYYIKKHVFRQKENIDTFLTVEIKRIEIEGKPTDSKFMHEWVFWNHRAYGLHTSWKLHECLYSGPMGDQEAAAEKNSGIFAGHHQQRKSMYR